MVVEREASEMKVAWFLKRSEWAIILLSHLHTRAQRRQEQKNQTGDTYPNLTLRGEWEHNCYGDDLRKQ